MNRLNVFLKSRAESAVKELDSVELGNSTSVLSAVALAKKTLEAIVEQMDKGELK